jgi:hypothetical protein
MRDVRGRQGLVIHHTRVVLPYHRIRGIPVAEPLRVLLDLAIDLRGRPLQRLVGEALYHRLVTDRDIDGAASRYPGHAGLSNLCAISPEDARQRRTVLPLAERMLLALDELPIPPPICEHRLFGQSGREYRADFAWPNLGYVLEADGRSAHERRDADLLLTGVKTIRFTGRQFDRERRRFKDTVSALVGVSGQTV